MKNKKIIPVTANPIFTKLKNNSERYFHGSECQVAYHEYSSLIVSGIKKIRPSLTIKLTDGSWIQIGSGDLSDQIEIMTIAAPNGKGKGSFLMKVFLKFVLDVIGYIPKICLECTGDLTANGYIFISSVSSQTKFFRKFGFRVKSRKGYPYYVKMEFDHTKIKLQELHFDQFTMGGNMAA